MGYPIPRYGQAVISRWRIPLNREIQGRYTNFQLIIYGKGKRIFIMVQVKIPDREVIKKRMLKY